MEAGGIKNVNADHAASHLGKAQGLVQLLRYKFQKTYLIHFLFHIIHRSVPAAKKINFIPYPQEILNKNKVSHEEILRCAPSERLIECTYEVASRAHQHLTKARSLMKIIPNEARATLLPAVPIEDFLMKLQKVSYDILHPTLQNKSRIWIAKLWLKNVTNKY